VIRLGRGAANVRTLDVDRPSRTRDSATVTAAGTPSTTGAPARAATASASPAIPPQPRTITSAPSSDTAAAA
jgi:hypothetical protein